MDNNMKTMFNTQLKISSILLLQQLGASAASLHKYYLLT
jgi:hypothetical protein